MRFQTVSHPRSSQHVLYFNGAQRHHGSPDRFRHKAEHFAVRPTFPARRMRRGADRGYHIEDTKHVPKGPMMTRRSSTGTSSQLSTESRCLPSGYSSPHNGSSSIDRVERSLTTTTTTTAAASLNGAFSQQDQSQWKAFPHHEVHVPPWLESEFRESRKKQQKVASATSSLSAVQQHKTYSLASTAPMDVKLPATVCGSTSDHDKEGQKLPSEVPQKLKPMKLQFYRTKMCPWVIASGHCRKDSSCRYAHSVEELRPLPDLSKTKMCEALLKNGHCPNIDCCKYAHSYDELRATQSFSKTKLCPAWRGEGCLAGKSCRFAHGEEELRTCSATKEFSDPGVIPQNNGVIFASTNGTSTTQHQVSTPPIALSYWQTQQQPQQHFALADPLVDVVVRTPPTASTTTWTGGSVSENSATATATAAPGGQLIQSLSPISLSVATNALVYLSSQLQWGGVDRSSGAAFSSPLEMDDHLWQQQQQQRSNMSPLEGSFLPETGGDTTRFLTHLLPSGIFTPMTRRAADQFEHHGASDITPDLQKSDLSGGCDFSWGKPSSSSTATTHQSSREQQHNTGNISPTMYYATAVPLYAQPVGPGLVSNLMFRQSQNAYPLGGPTSPSHGTNIVLSPTRMALQRSPAVSPLSVVPTSRAWQASAHGQFLPLPLLQSPLSAGTSNRQQTSGTTLTTDFPGFPTAPTGQTLQTVPRGSAPLAEYAPSLPTIPSPMRPQIPSSVIEEKNEGQKSVVSPPLEPGIHVGNGLKKSHSSSSEDSPSLFSSKSSSERTSIGLSPPPLTSGSSSTAGSCDQPQMKPV